MVTMLTLWVHHLATAAFILLVIDGFLKGAKEGLGKWATAIY